MSPAGAAGGEGDLLDDGHERVQGGGGVLLDEGDAGAVGAPLGGEWQEVGGAEGLCVLLHEQPLGARLGCEGAGEGGAGEGLAGTGGADECGGGARGELEADAVDEASSSDLDDQPPDNDCHTHTLSGDETRSQSHVLTVSSSGSRGP